MTVGSGKDWGLSLSTPVIVKYRDEQDRHAHGARTVDSLGLIPLARTLIDIDSTTGREGDCGRWLATYLRYLGWTVEEQPVSGDRINVIASIDRRRWCFSTHFDCVPPFVTSRVDGDTLYGRGACDAKGTLAAQVMAAERLRADGRAARRPGVRRRRGARQRRSQGRKRPSARCRLPVSRQRGADRRAARHGHRGILRVKLSAKGRAAHSSRPELGESAIDKLIDALIDLRAQELPEDELLGRTHYTIGLISGGIAPNVVSPHAEAEVMFRTVGPTSRARARAGRHPRARVDTTPILEVPAVRLTTVDGFETQSFPFTTDIPFLDAWGEPLLFGPGSVLLAHTDDEHVAIEELERAVDSYAAIAGTAASRVTTVQIEGLAYCQRDRRRVLPSCSRTGAPASSMLPVTPRGSVTEPRDLLAVRR